MITFARDEGPILALAIGLCLLLGFLVQFSIGYHQHVRQVNNWINQHQESIQKVMMLGHLTHSLGEKLPPCPHCKEARYQFWNFGRGLITYRCNSCLEVIPIRAFSSGQVRLVLAYLPALLIILQGVKTHKENRLGYRLTRLCEPVTDYCQRYFSRLEQNQQ